MLELHEEADGKILVVRMSGKLTKEDYKYFIPAADRLLAMHGTIRVLCQMHEFHGWEMGALWEDIKFDVKHYADIERVALVGDRIWQQGMALFCKPFTKAKVRYFDESDFQQATEWIWADLPAVRHPATALARHDAVQEASEESFPASDAPAY